MSFSSKPALAPVNKSRRLFLDNVRAKFFLWDFYIKMKMCLTMSESDRIEVNLYPLYMRPWHHRLKLIY